MEFYNQIFRRIEKNLKACLFASAAFCFIFTILVPIFNNGNVFRIIAAVGLTVFVIFHGLYHYGLEKMSIFLIITFLVSWTLETISISSGIPFGEFYYTELLGAKAGTVPWGIMLAYFFTGYLAWTVSTIIFNESSGGIKKNNVVLVPIVSATIMVLWNFTFDPVLSSIERNWVWVNSGWFHGVPIINSFGWFVTTYMFFQLFAIYLFIQKEEKQVERSRWYWYLVPIMLFIQVLEYVIHPFLRTEYLNIYKSSFWTAILGIGTVSLLSLLIIYRKYKQRE